MKIQEDDKSPHMERPQRIASRTQPDLSAKAAFKWKSIQNCTRRQAKHSPYRDAAVCPYKETSHTSQNFFPFPPVIIFFYSLVMMDL